MELSLGLAFVAGVVSFISPCVLGLLPVYLAYLGETAATLSSAGGATAAVSLRRPLLGQAALFTLSFGAVFVVLGISIGLVGASLFALAPWVRQVAGIVVIGLGILMTGIAGPVLDRIRLGPTVRELPTGRSLRSITLGGLFALGWSPCIGPVLGAILTLGASSADVTIAALLLVAYSLGLALPFLLAAVALPQLTPVLTTLRRGHTAVQVVAGLFVVAMGVLIYFNAFARMASLFTFVL